jgi:hypothetical protein
MSTKIETTGAQERRCILPAQLTDDGRCSGHCNPGYDICGWCAWGLSKHHKDEYRTAHQNREADPASYRRVLVKLRMLSRGWLSPTERLTPELLAVWRECEDNQREEYRLKRVGKRLNRGRRRRYRRENQRLRCKNQRLRRSLR